MDFMSSRDNCEDVLGFTRQTAVLLSGMGAKDLVPQFKQRNISTELLADLTLADLQLLGADYELANNMLKQFTAIAKRNNKTTLTPQQKLDQLLQVLTNNNKHLSLIQAFITYARLRIGKERVDSFIERNNILRCSTALEIAAEATICEIKETRLAVEELRLFLEDNGRSTSFGLYITLLSGIGLATFVILKKCT